MRKTTLIKFSSSIVAIEKQAIDTVVIFARGKILLGDNAKALDKASKGKLKRLIKSGDLGEKTGDSISIFQPEQIKAKRIILIQSGELPLGDRAFIDFADSIAECCLQALSLIHI